MQVSNNSANSIDAYKLYSSHKVLAQDATQPSKNEDKNDEEIRDIKEGKVDITELIDAINAHRNAIERVNYKVDERVELMLSGKEISMQEALVGFNPNQLLF